MEKQDAMVFPSQVIGIMSPYPIVVTVTFWDNDKKKNKAVIKLSA